MRGGACFEFLAAALKYGNITEYPKYRRRNDVYLRQSRGNSLPKEKKGGEVEMKSEYRRN